MPKAITIMRFQYIFSFALSSLLFLACQPEEKEKGLEKEQETVQTEVEVKSEIDSLSELIDKEPSKALFMVRAEAYNKLGRFDRSIVDAKKVYEYSKDDYDNMIFYADMLMDALIYNPNLIEEAKVIYEKAVEMYPEKAGGYLGMGKVYTLVNNPEEAFTFINKALKMDETLSEAYYLKGFLYQSQGKVKLAVSSYMTSVEQDPEFTEGYIVLGSILSKYGDVKSQQMAEGYFRTALTIEPLNKDAFYGLGMLYQNQDKLDSAMAQYRTIVKIDPNYAIAWFNQGWVYMNRSDEIDSAIFYFEHAIEADSLYADAYNNLGYCYEKKKDLNQAKSYYLKAIEVDPMHEKAKKNLQTLYK
ncbi:MAG: tetratricopeptide repeat protein [Crocinitomicaceae bacterium]